MCEIFLNLTFILLPSALMSQSLEPEGSDKSAGTKEVHSILHSFQASLCTLTATHLTRNICLHIHSNFGRCTVRFVNQAGITISTILNWWETPGKDPVTSGLTSVYQSSSSTT